MGRRQGATHAKDGEGPILVGLFTVRPSVLEKQENSPSHSARALESERRMKTIEEIQLALNLSLLEEQQHRTEEQRQKARLAKTQADYAARMFRDTFENEGKYAN